MNTILRFYWGQLLAAVAALSIGYALGQHRLIALALVFFGFIWLVARRRNSSGIGGLVMTSFLLAGGLGPLFGAPAWLMLLAIVTTLGAWDLDHFMLRLSGIDQVDYSTGLRRSHLTRLGLVQGLGFLLGLLALTLRTSIPLALTMLLVLLAVIGVRWLVWYVRRITDR